MAQAPQVRLEAVDGKTSFAIGDKIALELVFTGPASDATVNTSDYGDLSEDVTLSPAEGWFQWSGKSGHDYLNSAKLGETPLRVPLLLNHGFVFQKPGHYQVTVTTHRLSLKGEDWKTNGRTTNTLDLLLTAPDDEAEAAKVKLLDARIMAATEFEERDEAVTELAFLGGDAAIRSKVRWLNDLRDDEMAGNLLADLQAGLSSSRNLALQQSLLEARWRDTTQPPDWSTLDALMATQWFARSNMVEGWHMVVAPKTDEETRRAAAVRMSYLHELVLSLPARSGENRRDAAYLLMETGGLAPVDQARVRRAVLDEFAHMDNMAQSMLLETRWKEVKDASLVPSLTAMLDSKAKDANHRDSLERLIELDPERARPYVIRAICDPRENVQLKQLGGLPVGTLPEVDKCLAAQMPGLMSPTHNNKGVAGPPIFVGDDKMRAAARYATSAILPAVRAELAEVKGKVAAMYEGSFVAYLLRWAPAEAMAEIKRSGDADFYELNEVYAARQAKYPVVLDEWLEGQVKTGTLEEATHAAYYLSQFGRPEGRVLVEARLLELRKGAASRVTEAELDKAEYGSEAGKLREEEVQLAEALMHYESAWKWSVDRTAMSAGCMSTRCREVFSPPVP